VLLFRNDYVMVSRLFRYYCVIIVWLTCY